MREYKAQGFQVMMLVVAVIIAVSILGILSGILGNIGGGFGKKLSDVVKDVAVRAYNTPGLKVGPEIASVDKGGGFSKDYISQNSEIPDGDINNDFIRCTNKLSQYAEGCNSQEITFKRKMRVTVFAYYSEDRGLKICLGTDKEKLTTKQQCGR